MSNWKRHVALLALLSLSLGLSGCGKLVKYLADGESSGITSPGDLYVAETDSSKVAERTLQGLYPCFKQDDKNGATEGGEKLYSGFLRQEMLSRCNWDNQEYATRFMQSGVAMSDQMCHRWFNDVANAQTALHSSRDALGPLGSIVAAVLGFTGANADAIGVTASAFTFAQDSLSSVENNYIFSADIPVVWQAVRDHRAKWYTDSIQSAQPKSYDEARKILDSYNFFCTQVGVRQFITQKVARQTSDGSAPLREAALNKVVTEMIRITGNTGIGLQDIVAYYALKFGTVDQSVRPKVLEEAKANKLINAEGQIVDAQGALLTVAKIEKVNALLTSQDIKAALDAELAGLSDRLKAPAAGNPATPMADDDDGPVAPSREPVKARNTRTKDPSQPPPL